MFLVAENGGFKLGYINYIVDFMLSGSHFNLDRFESHGSQVYYHKCFHVLCPRMR